jgi:hypothetical protein
MLGFLNAAASLLRVTQIVENLRGWRFMGRFREQVHRSVVITTMKTFQCCEGFIGWGHYSSAIVGGTTDNVEFFRGEDERRGSS